MATIGRVTRKDNGNYEGFVRTMTVQAGIRFEKIEKTKPSAPDFRIFADNNFEIGAAWIKESQQGNEYISLTLDAPELPNRLNANLGREGGQDDEDVFAIIWNRAA